MNRSSSARPASLASAQELGALVGISSRSVRELAERGVIQRSPAGRYDLAASVAAYCAHLREMAAARGGGSSLTQERERAARERADQLALKNAQTRRELVPAAEVAATWSQILRDVRAGLLAIPSRAQQRLPHLSASDVSTLDAEVRAALSEIANDV